MKLFSKKTQQELTVDEIAQAVQAAQEKDAQAEDAQLESGKLSFIWGQNEDCSPGGSTSDSSARLPQRGRGGRSIYKVLRKGEFSTIKHSFYKTFPSSQEDLMSS